MLVQNLKDCQEFIAGDNTILRELLHPDKQPVALRYSLAHATLPVGKTSQPHSLTTSEVYYILSGQGEMHIDDETQIVSSGDAVYIPPKPMVDTGMTKEQEERCLRGRKVTDTLNAVQTTAYRLANQQVAKAAASTVSALAPPAQTLSSEPHSGS